VGDNGSGKSTFMKILLGVVSADKGTVSWNDSYGVNISHEQVIQQIGFVSPYLMLYDEFTPLELMKHCSGMRGSIFKKDHSMELLTSMQLSGVENRNIGAFSSGMKQRMKYVLALQHSPSVLLLDEPMANLDAKGISCVEGIIEQSISSNHIVLIATNDERDIALCDEVVSVMK
jgi:heme exporter protein A